MDIKEISKQKIIKMINSGSTDLSEDEIKNLIRQKTSENNASIDEEYIDLCFDLLVISNRNHRPELKIRSVKKPVKAALIAAVAAVLCFSTITVSANVFHLDIPHEIAMLISGNAEIDTNFELVNTTADGYALTDTELAKQLADNGISPVTLPEALVTDNCTITNVEITSTDFSKDAAVDFAYKNQNGCITISQFSDDYSFVGDTTEMNVISGQILKANGMDILIFERKDSCTIEYKDNLTEYNIMLECDLDTAIKFAETIK